MENLIAHHLTTVLDDGVRFWHDPYPGEGFLPGVNS